MANTFFIFFDSIKPLIKLIKHLISDFQILFHSIKRPLIKNPKDTKLQPPFSLKIRRKQIRTTLKCFQIQMKNQRLTIRRYRTFKLISLAKLIPFLIINLPNIEIHFIQGFQVDKANKLGIKFTLSLAIARDMLLDGARLRDLYFLPARGNSQLTDEMRLQFIAFF